jgi:adenylate kinase
MNKHLILIGAPGSGKGTQASILSKKHNYKHISTGDLLRAEIARLSPLGQEVKKVIDAGELVSDELVLKLLKANIDLGKESYVFDGYPRNLEQAQALDTQILQGHQFLSVYFKINESKLIARLTNRRTCKDCGAIYNLLLSKPKKDGICDSCGSKNLVHRNDDQEDVIKNRLTIFKKTIEPVLTFYREKKRLVEADAESSVEELNNLIVSKIRSL